MKLDRHFTIWLPTFNFLTEIPEYYGFLDLKYNFVTFLLLFFLDLTLLKYAKFPI